MCQTTHCVSNYTLCVKLHTLECVWNCTLFVKPHILCNIKAVSYTYPLENFTLDWFILHNQRLWWLWQIWSMDLTAFYIRLVNDTKLICKSNVKNCHYNLARRAAIHLCFKQLACCKGILIIIPWHDYWLMLIIRMVTMVMIVMMVMMARMKTSSLVDIGNHPPLRPGPPTPRVAVTPEWPSLITLVDT